MYRDIKCLVIPFLELWQIRMETHASLKRKFNEMENSRVFANMNMIGTAYKWLQEVASRKWKMTASPNTYGVCQVTYRWN